MVQNRRGFRCKTHARKMPTRLKNRYRRRITHRHFVSRSTSDDLSPTSSAWPNWAVSPLFPLTTTLVHWVNSCHQDHRFANLPRPYPPKKLSIQTSPFAPLTSIKHRSCRAFSLGCRKLPLPSFLALAPATHLAWIPGCPSHFRSTPAPSSAPYCTFQSFDIPNHQLQLI